MVLHTLPHPLKTAQCCILHTEGGETERPPVLCACMAGQYFLRSGTQSNKQNYIYVHATAYSYMYYTGGESKSAKTKFA